MQYPAEKRRYKRMKHSARVTLESLQIGIQENSRMVNYSDNGLYFESDQFLQPEAEIFIRVEDSTEDPIETYQCHHAKVIWGKRLNNKSYSYGYGVKYFELTDDEESGDEDSGQIRELRKYPRLHCGKPANFGVNNKFYSGVISDISRNGCFIENAESLRIGQILDLVIAGTRFSRYNKLKVLVVRLSPIGVGVRFRSIIKRSPGNRSKRAETL